ncbi:CsgG/HfaB family protein [Catenovulum sediminis]|uniref:Curli production assembly/transport component CsgG n=2 Tax=Catenovulum sediminis TaxID=1740262 RepID=A0ABV1RKP4_9ALTE|nr:CsgG/HfaB family protein [Catenovulum sediminis]
MVKSLLTVSATIILLAGCASQSHRKVEVEPVKSYQTPYTGPKTTLVVGEFNNRSNYMQGMFSNNAPQLANQSKTILKAHLTQTNRFKMVDRENLEQITKEAELRGEKLQLKGARYAITGAVTEFGRKNVGDKQLFGILGSGKSQIAYAKVTVNIVDVLTSEVIYSTQGAGEYSLSEREVLGFGSKAGYDSTLNGKVLDFAIKECVNNMVRDLESGVLNVNI